MIQPTADCRNHVLITSETCDHARDDERFDKLCPVCDGGLAVCSVCGEYEAGLDRSCMPKDNDFSHVWATAPRSMRNYVEQTIAAYWFYRGRNAGQAEAAVTSNADLREMRRMLGGRSG